MFSWTKITPISQLCSEYGLGIVQSWINFLDTEEDVLRDLTDLHQNGLRWIAATTRNAHTCVLEKLTNLPNVHMRASLLHCQFYFHLLRLPPEHAFHLIQHRSQFSPHTTSTLFHTLFPPGTTPTKSSLKEKLYRHFLNSHSTHLLCTYIKHTHPRYDGLFNNPCRRTQLASLRWRRNAFTPNKFKCPVDGDPLSRSHVNHAIQIYVEPLIGEGMCRKWEEEKLQYPGGKYTILDFLLNHHLYNIFMDCIFILFDDE